MIYCDFVSFFLIAIFNKCEFKEAVNELNVFVIIKLIRSTNRCFIKRYNRLLDSIRYVLITMRKRAHATTNNNPCADVGTLLLQLSATPFH